MRNATSCPHAERKLCQASAHTNRNHLRGRLQKGSLAPCAASRVHESSIVLAEKYCQPTIMIIGN